MAREFRTSDDWMIAYTRRRALKILGRRYVKEQKGCNERRNSHEGYELKCVSGVHCVDCHAELEDTVALLREGGREQYIGSNILCECEYTEVDRHLLERSLVPLLCVVEADEKIAFDGQINSGLDEDDDHEKTACHGVWQDL
jgi:hypothetical protein